MIFSKIELGKSERGFTLLELLLSLALLAIILSTLFSWFGLSKRGWERSSFTEQTSELLAVRFFLRQKIERALPFFRAGSAAKKPLLAFEGTQTGITFMGTSVGFTEIGGVYEYHFAIQARSAPDGSVNMLVAQQRLSALPSYLAPLKKPTNARVLVDNLHGVRFSYFGSQTGATRPVWQDTWRSSDRLPKLVRLDIDFAGKDERSWPSLVIALKLAQTPPSH